MICKLIGLGIHQSHGERTAAAINRLPLFLQKSKVLYSFFDLTYTTRMWCVFELAVYLRTRKNPKIIFTSIGMRVIEIAVITASVVCNLIIDVTEDVTGADKIKAYQDEGQKNAYLITGWLVWGINLVVSVFIYYLGDRHYRALVELQGAMKNYDINTAQLGVESDRVFLLRIVDELFRHHGTSEPEKKFAAVSSASASAVVNKESSSAGGENMGRSDDSRMLGHLGAFRTDSNLGDGEEEDRGVNLATGEEDENSGDGGSG